MKSCTRVHSQWFTYRVNEHHSCSEIHCIESDDIMWFTVLQKPDFLLAILFCFGGVFYTALNITSIQQCGQKDDLMCQYTALYVII